MLPPREVPDPPAAAASAPLLPVCTRLPCVVRLPLLALMMGPRAPLPCWPPADRLLRLLLLRSSAAACELLPLTVLLLLPARVKRIVPQASFSASALLRAGVQHNRHNAQTKQSS